MSGSTRRGNAEVLSALAAITGQAVTDTDAAFHEEKEANPDKTRADRDEAAALIARVKARLGIAPAVTLEQARELGRQLDSIVGDDTVTITTSDLVAWDNMLRHTPESIPDVKRDPVVMPLMPEHQAHMWNTLLDLEDLQHPWVLVGGQMTFLHCVENDYPQRRPTDDGDIVVGVWTRRDALAATSHFLRSKDFTEAKTSDGYGYRYIHDNKTAIDVLLPEGLERQSTFPTTATGRPGLTTPGANQALTRAERVPINLNGRVGYIRRPTLLGAIVAKANAHQVDSRDKNRHAEDIIALADIASRNPRAALEQARPGDRKVVRRFIRNVTANDPQFETATDPQLVYNFLKRLADN